MVKQQLEIKSFSALGLQELYDLLKLRQDVFIIEQQSIYADLDERDQVSKHVLLKEGSQLIGIARIVPKGETYDAVSVGRIATAASHRGQGLGKKIIEAALDYCDLEIKTKTVKISAQLHLEAYYQSFGFETISAPYDDGGVLHIDMKRVINA